MKQALENAKQLRIQARERLGAQQLEEALLLLDQAIDVLQAENLEKSVELYRDLAESYGMRGGVLRRLRRRKEAIQSYVDGAKHEQDEEFGTDDTYNLVNSVVLPLSEAPSLLDDDEYRMRLLSSVRQLRRQIRGTRSNDFWAQADLARCLVLLGNLEEAKACIDRFVQLPGSNDGYATTVQALRELGEALASADRPEAKLIDEAVQYFRRASELGSALERPSCFVLMPFGKKGAAGKQIDFDAIYTGIIAPAIRDAGLEPLRADAEPGGGVIHKAMFERLLISEFAVADLTLNNPNVFYELGVRHGNSARATALMSAEQAAPFDVALLRTLRYRVDENGLVASEEAARVRSLLCSKLSETRQSLHSTGASDNPIAALLQDFKSFDVPSRLKADVFREQANYAMDIKRRLAEARQAPREQALRDLRDIEEHLPFEQREPGALIDMMLSYRGIEAWDDMIAFIARLPKVVRDTEFVREQHALALNRRHKGTDRSEALEILEGLIAERGESSETYGLMGRVYKDMWADTRTEEPLRARGILRKAIEAYRKGFEADIRDTFPGINLLTLLDVHGSPDGLEESKRTLPVVHYAAKLRLKNKPDYWDHATMLELSALAQDDAEIERHLENALAAIREQLEPQTTASNLRFIAEARQARTPSEAPSPSLEQAIAALEKAASKR